MNDTDKTTENPQDNISPGGLKCVVTKIEDITEGPQLGGKELFITAGIYETSIAVLPEYDSFFNEYAVGQKILVNKEGTAIIWREKHG